ncbi:MAG: anti-sigma factor [Nitrospirota bacterium]|nr:anti-sigma factor [Nitrospirota bacterium]
MEETDPDHQHFEEAAPIYATGGLEPKEREEFEAHLETGCSVCFDLLKELQPTNQFEPDDPELVHSETLKKIPEHDPPEEAPPADASPMEDIPEDAPPIHSQVQQEHDSQTSAWSKVRPVLTSGVLALVLVVVAAGSLWYALSGRTDLSHLVEERQQLELEVKEITQRMARFQDRIKEQASIVREIRELQKRPPADSTAVPNQSSSPSTQEKALTAKLAKKKRENASLLRKVTAISEYKAFVQSSRLHVVPFVGKRSVGAKAFLFHDPETRNVLFYGAGLPPLPPNSVYQLWALIGKPVSLGTFKLDDGRNGRLWLKNIVKLAPGTKFAVSVERGRGASKPTGEIYLLGELQKSS